MKLFLKKCILLFLLPLGVFAQSELFEKGTQVFGLTNLGLGYSSATGLSVSANTRYEYFLLNRFAVGGSAFYNNFNNHEWMGVGPIFSYVPIVYYNWFAKLDTQIIAAKFNGFDDPPASVYGTSSLSINYIQPESSFYIGGGYGISYPLGPGRVLYPTSLQFFAGILWR